MSFENLLQSIEVYENGISITNIIGKKIITVHQTESFYICDIGDIIKKSQLWKSLLPRVKPFYAVKANDNNVVLKVLDSLGVNFDCASKNEIDQILSLGIEPNRIVYAHTVKPPSYIKYAAKVGVNLLTFDNEEELRKMKEVYANVEAIIRIRSDAKKALLTFGTKFGCDAYSEGSQLIGLARNLQINVVGVSFHVGLGCKDLEAFEIAIKSARYIFDVAKEYGYNLRILDLGGGFPGNNNKYFEEITTVINSALDTYFSDLKINVIAEPGTFFVDSAFTLACNVVGKKVNSQASMYYLNDGIFGSFNSGYYFNIPMKMHPLKKYVDEKLYSSVIFGTTCSTVDKLTDNVLLPALEIGDWLIFQNMGAYSLNTCCTFNGFLPPCVFHVIDSNELAVLRINPDEKKKIPKFGCNVATEANQLISLASELKIDLVGVSFHIGSYSKDMDLYVIAIKLARDVFNLAAKYGFNLRILDIGGAYSGINNDDFRNAAKLINEALDNYFSDLSVEIMAEPGAFFVDSALTLACNVVSKKYCSDQWAYYINDGVSGSFYSRSKINLPLKMHSLKKYTDKKLYPSVIFGATCSNVDELTNSISLPALDLGDWLIFKNMGAYTITTCTTFNGFPIPPVNNVITLKTWSELKDIFGLNDDYIKYKELKKNEEYQFNSEEECGLTFTIEGRIFYSG